MVDTQTVIIGNAVVVSIGTFFIRMWVKSVNEKLKEISDKLDTKVSDSLCCERRKGPKEDIDDLFGRMREVEARGRA